MSTSADRQIVIELLAQGKPVWYVAAMLNKDRHEVYLIGRSAGYPDLLKLRRIAWLQTHPAVA
jgi:hypothetical protein